jgi:TatD DNase family protein
MLLTDTHTHLYYEIDEQKQALLIERCIKNEVKRLFLPNVDVASIKMIDNLVSKYPEYCYAMSGLHPCDVKDGFEEQLNKIYQSIADRKIYAIGEIGIDLYWDKTTFGYSATSFQNANQLGKGIRFANSNTLS